jgi:hypothetical protein
MVQLFTALAVGMLVAAAATRSFLERGSRR